MAGSEPSWPSRAVPPDGAPNIVIVLVDDVGFSDLGCYGGEIHTPNLDRLAAEGVRFSNFHVNPMCSPTRAALLTGRATRTPPASATSARTIPGFPGYRGELAANVATAAEILRDAGYATLTVGKWHLCRDADCSAAGPKHSWPVQRGLRALLRLPRGFTNLHHPHQLIDDNHVVERDEYPAGYFLTDDLTDRAITFVKERKAANPRQPFFLYLAHGAAHAPLVAKAADISRYESVYGAGWDEIRRRATSARSSSGCCRRERPSPTATARTATTWRRGTICPSTEQAVFARYMAVYAAMVDELDQSIGQLRSTLEMMGEWDNTVLVFLSDNGASREGQSGGTTNYYSHLRLGADVGDVEVDATRLLELIGSPRTMSHYPRAGRWRRTRRSGSTSATPTPAATGCRASGTGPPVSLGQAGSTRTQYGHCVDVLPTLLDVVGLRPPTERDGRATETDERCLAGATAARRLVRRAASRAVLRVAGQPRLLCRRLGDRDPADAPDPVQPSRTGSSTTCAPIPPRRPTSPPGIPRRSSSSPLASPLRRARTRSTRSTRARPGVGWCARRTTGSSRSRSRSGPARRRSTAGAAPG